MLPMTMARIPLGEPCVLVKSVLGHQLANAPGTARPDIVTRLEEDRIVAYYGAGTLYATPSRQEPLL
jgi:photosynthetic reaction center H subunit